MEIFNLPPTSIVNKVIPKNAFDKYTTTRQKRLFTDLVSRIIWTHKLSADTVNLAGKKVEEIQIFSIELKAKEEIKAILDIIDKAIPYNIIFIVLYSDNFYFSTSIKHRHPTNEDVSIVDWTFKSGWTSPSVGIYSLHLKKNLDAVYHDFCVQLSGRSGFSNKPLISLIDFAKELSSLEKEISGLKAKLATCGQFNIKVELNILIRKKQERLNAINTKEDYK
jgi:hypothetical protein